jgi:6-phosphogluconolactonase
VSILPVLAGSYSGPDGPGIRDYALDTATGRLTQTSATSGVPYPAYLVQGPRPGWAYAVSETTSSTDVGLGTVPAQTGTPGSVWALRPAAGGVGHEPAGSRPSEGELPTHLTLHPGGRWLVVANYGAATIAGSVAVLPIRQDGSLGPVADLHRHEGSGPVETRQPCAHVHSTIFSPDGRHLIAADLGADALVTYRFDERDGRLMHAWTTPTPPGWGPRYLAWHRPNPLLLAVGELACEAAAFEFDGSLGRLRMETRVPTLLTQPDGPVLAADMALTPDRSRLLVSNRGARDSITTIEVRRDGGLAQLAEAPCGAWPRDFDLTPDGRLAVVANEHSDALTVLRVDGDGVVGEELASVPLPHASFVAVGRPSSEHSERVHR